MGVAGTISASNLKTYQQGSLLIGMNIASGTQTITSVAGTCVAGTTITFPRTYTAAPNVVMSPIVGGSSGIGITASAGTITTTTFVPNLCTIAGGYAGAVGVTWMSNGW